MQQNFKSTENAENSSNLGTLETHTWMIVETRQYVIVFQHFELKSMKCQRTKKKTGTLSRQVNIHDEKKVQTCRKCGKLFTETGTLTKHMNSYDEEMV